MNALLDSFAQGKSTEGERYMSEGFREARLALYIEDSHK
jgi:hypothetical protein